MNKRSNQSGFAHLVIITVILAVALVGTLGFVFWQNFMQPKHQTSGNSTGGGSSKTGDSDKPKTDPSQIALSEVASDQNRGTGLAIKYPSTWSVTHESNNTESGKPESYNILSPDGKVKVFFMIGQDGVGGTCDPSDTTYVVSQAEYEAIPQYSKARYIEYVTHSTADDTYAYFAGTQINNQYTSNSIKAGDQACVLGMPGFFTPLEGTLGYISITFTAITNGTKTTLNEVETAIKTDNYKIAKRIVESLYVK